MGNEMIEDKAAIKIISDSRHFNDLIDNHFLEKTTQHPTPIKLLIPVGYEHFSFTHKAYHKTLQIHYLTKQQIRNGGMAVWWQKIALHSYEGVYITTTIIENWPISAMIEASFQSMRNQSSS